MHPVIDELHKVKESGPNERKLSPSLPVVRGREEGQNGNGARNDEDDFHIMQHFVRDLIEGS